MNQKSIFIGITDSEVRRSGALTKEVGQEIFVFAKFLGEYKSATGVVVAVYDDAHGRTLILHNLRKGQTQHLCSGWEYIPIWIGCGQSGIAAPWKDPITSDRLTVEKTIAEFRRLTIARSIERQALNAMAL